MNIYHCVFIRKNEVKTFYIRASSFDKIPKDLIDFASLILVNPIVNIVKDRYSIFSYSKLDKISDVMKYVESLKTF